MKSIVKKVVIGLTASSMCVLALIGNYHSSVHEPSDVILQNVEVLTQQENSGQEGNNGSGTGTLWIRLDGNCVYEVEGCAKGEVSINIAGVGIIKIKVGADGKASYTYSGGKTNCTAGGNEQCTARYCPALI